jgi:predicted metal-dependent hydrolase
MRLTIHPDGAVVVTVPALNSRAVQGGVIERFVQARRRWIADKLDYFKSLGPQVFVPRISPRMSRAHSRAEYARYKEQARELAERKVSQWNAWPGYSFKVGRIFIRNQKTRWGSCSARGNLNFNYKIALLPERLADYLVVHELCHLGQMNHSRKFWDLVALAIPDYKERRKELRKIGTTMVLG